jgi:Calcineurin-like phosphoesterase superfamily domain
MRVAIISDLHGNTFALEAILEDIAKQGVDQIIVAGDSVNVHPNSKQCWDMVVALGCPVLQGNHEQYMYRLNTPSAEPEWTEEHFQTIRYFHSQFSSADLEKMRALPFTYSLPDLLICHATPGDAFKSLFSHSTPIKLENAFAGTTENNIVRGHNHNWFTTHWNERKLHSIDAAGLPLTGKPVAPYAILSLDTTWSLEKRLMNYDHQAAVAAMNDEFMANVGAMGHLWRLELQTAQPHLNPFFKKYFAALECQEIGFEEAVNQYCSSVK